MRYYGRIYSKHYGQIVYFTTYFKPFNNLSDIEVEYFYSHSSSIMESDKYYPLDTFDISAYIPISKIYESQNIEDINMWRQNNTIEGNVLDVWIKLTNRGSLQGISIADPYTEKRKEIFKVAYIGTALSASYIMCFLFFYKMWCNKYV